MKKRILCLLLTLAMLLSMGTGVAAANDNITIEIDGKEVAFSSTYGYPYVDENGRTQVPLRVVMEQYGCKVEWDDANNAAVITNGTSTVIVPIGKNYIIVDGKTVAMDTAAVVKDGRTYLPIRPVLEAFGADVDWNNGEIAVSKPATGTGFENIYVDDNGNLIFELANGNKINAGAVSAKDGQDGRDGVSVTNVYVDGAGNLMVSLSSGRTINAGNVGTGGSMSGLTFADYAVGTRFYLTQPTGEFDVKVQNNGTTYNVHFDEVYYELSAKYDYDDEAAWTYKDGQTVYIPYQVTVHISGTADTALAGSSLEFGFGAVGDGNLTWSYGGTRSNCVVSANGSFSTELIQGGGNNANVWYAPKQLYFKSVSITTGGTGGTGGSTGALTQQDCIDLVKGDYCLSPTKKLTVNEDGTIEVNGNKYTVTYSGNGTSGTIFADDTESDDCFYFFLSENGVSHNDPIGRRYHKDRTWTTIELTEENFLDYFEYKEVLDIRLDNTYHEFDSASLYYRYVLKDEYAQKLDLEAVWSDDTLPGVKYSYDYTFMDYTIDVSSNTYSTTKEENDYSMHYDDKVASFHSEYIQIGLVSLHSVSGSSHFCENIEITDVSGTLYLIND